jgi:hypothetical protein
MKLQNTLLILAAIGCFGLAGAPNLAQAPSGAAPDTGPDPREIPVPHIAAPLGTLPGVNELPVQPEPQPLGRE